MPQLISSLEEEEEEEAVFLRVEKCKFRRILVYTIEINAQFTIDFFIRLLLIAAVGYWVVGTMGPGLSAKTRWTGGVE